MQLQDFENIETKDILDRVFNLWKPDTKISISIIGWQDGDFFKELCLENGGFQKDSVELFEKIPFIEDYSNFENFKQDFQSFSVCEFIGSANLKYKFVYDIEIWIDKNYWIYNPYLHRMKYKKLNYFEKLFGFSKLPDWIDHDLIYKQ